MNGTHAAGSDGEALALTRSAVDRLRDVREHQWSLGHEFAHNWQGWLGSLVFHTTVFLLLAVLTWNVIAPPVPPEIPVLTQLEPSTAVTKEPIEDLLPPNTVRTDRPDEIPSMDMGGKEHSMNYPGADDQGVPDWIGRGWDDGIPGSGPPGDGLTGDIGRGVRVAGLHTLDVVFVFDSTGSMGGAILEVKTRIRQLMKMVTYFIPNTRLGIVTYRDKKKFDLDDFEYTVKFLSMTSPQAPDGMDKIERFLRETEAYGGGDIPEAVHEGVQTAIERLSWRQNAKKIVIVFGDAPPRPEDNGVSKLLDMIRGWHDRTGGVVSTIDTTGSSKLMDEFAQMARSGGGRSGGLSQDTEIVKQILVTIFPEEVSAKVQKYWEERIRKNAEEDEIRGK